MRFTRVIIHRVSIPMKTVFRHSRSDRSHAENVVVEVTTDSGVSGFGEGVPRDYVTGETPEGAVRYLERLDYSFISGGVRSLGEGVELLRDWEVSAAGGGEFFPGAARCALGIGLLDAITRSYGSGVGGISGRVSGLLPPEKRESAVRYSAVCSGGSIPRVMLTLIKFRLYGFRAVKLKVGWGEGRDEALVRFARKILGRGVDIRVDANGAWDFVAAARLIPRMGALGVSSVEEPLAPGQTGRLPSLRRSVNVPIMLDESVCSFSQLLDAVKSGSCDAVNVRLSKCGGFFASHRMAMTLQENGLGCQLGCHVGETAILSAAGRHFAFLVPGIKHIEGSYDRHILSDNIVNGDITFGYGGCAAPLDGPGLGVTVDRRRLARYEIGRSDIPI